VQYKNIVFSVVSAHPWADWCEPVKILSLLMVYCRAKFGSCIVNSEREQIGKDKTASLNRQRQWCTFNIM